MRTLLLFALTATPAWAVTHQVTPSVSVSYTFGARQPIGVAATTAWQALVTDDAGFTVGAYGEAGWREGFYVSAGIRQGLAAASESSLGVHHTLGALELETGVAWGPRHGFALRPGVVASSAPGGLGGAARVTRSFDARTGAGWGTTVDAALGVAALPMSYLLVTPTTR